MRGKEANAGSLRALLLVLALLVANLTATCLRQPERGMAQPPVSATERTARARQVATTDARRFVDAQPVRSGAFDVAKEHTP